MSIGLFKVTSVIVNIFSCGTGQIISGMVIWYTVNMYSCYYERRIFHQHIHSYLGRCFLGSGRLRMVFNGAISSQKVTDTIIDKYNFSVLLLCRWRYESGTNICNSFSFAFWGVSFWFDWGWMTNKESFCSHASCCWSFCFLHFWTRETVTRVHYLFKQNWMFSFFYRRRNPSKPKNPKRTKMELRMKKRWMTKMKKPKMKSMN